MNPLGPVDNSTLPGITREFSALRCSHMLIYAALRCSKIRSFTLGLANFQQTLGRVAHSIRPGTLLIIVSLLGAWSGAALAGNTPAAPQASSSLATMCPQPSELVKKKGNNRDQWEAPGGWRSYSPSFADQIKELKGVAWQGIRVGQIVCEYTPTASMNFPVVLYYNHYVYQPTGENWKKKKNDSAVCFSNNPSDCSFTPKPVEPPVDLNQVLENLRTAQNTQGLG